MRRSATRRTQMPAQPPDPDVPLADEPTRACLPYRDDRTLFLVARASADPDFVAV